MAWVVKGNSEGSSPLAWGAYAEPFAGSATLRFIPTRVGSMAFAWPDYRAIAVHPHSRGEHEDVKKIPKPILGSSPLVWGACDDRKLFL